MCIQKNCQIPFSIWVKGGGLTTPLPIAYGSENLPIAERFKRFFYLVRFFFSKYIFLYQLPILHFFLKFILLCYFFKNLFIVLFKTSIIIIYIYQKYNNIYTYTYILFLLFQQKWINAFLYLLISKFKSFHASNKSFHNGAFKLIIVFSCF